MSTADELEFSDLAISDAQAADQEREQLEREKGKSTTSEILRKRSLEAVRYCVFHIY